MGGKISELLRSLNSDEQIPVTPYEMLLQIYGPNEANWPDFIQDPTVIDLFLKKIGEQQSQRPPKRVP